jgi:LPPG:FO 2-phospho-L-lactate transferase
MTDAPPSVAVLCGGVGAARFLLGLRRIIPEERIVAVVNVADDIVLHGLHISPDLDTITYTLADEIDPERGWGLRHESWNAMTTIARFGDGDWFSLGDRDLGTHLHRTRRLQDGATLTEVTAELARGWNVRTNVLPVSDDPLATMVTLADERVELSFQEYFVGRRHDVAIAGVRFDGIDTCRPTVGALAAIESSDVVVVAPSNPIVSIGPLLAVHGVSDALRNRRAPTVAISPIVGGKALKGPTARMLAELGHDADSLGVARLLAGLIDVMVIDDADAPLAQPISEVGVTPFITNTVMSDSDRSAALARAVLSAAALGLGE